MKIQVAVLFGGRSVEHEISVISAIQAMESMNAERYDVLPVYLTKDNEFYTGEVLRDIKRYRDIPALLKDATRVSMTREDGKVVLKQVPAKRFGSSVLARSCTGPTWRTGHCRGSCGRSGSRSSGVTCWRPPWGWISTS